MDEIQQYQLVYTQAATQDILEKADYIAYQLKERKLSEDWYFSLRQTLQDQLSVFPYRYSLYDAEPWRSKGIRLLTAKNDVVLYSVEENTVYIHAVCTKGRDLSAHLEQNL